MSSHNVQKKIAAINDISGFGRCSLTVTLPVISKLKVQCCPVPTAILSNHTAFEHYFFDDYTAKMPWYIDMWEKLGLRFSGIYSGFLGSEEQIELVIDFIRRFHGEDTKVIIDPVMGDHGKPYVTYTSQMCEKMKDLVQYADILTPNLTEACILTGTAYKEKWRQEEICDLAQKLTAQGPKQVVITGIAQGGFIANYVCDGAGSPAAARAGEKTGKADKSLQKTAGTFLRTARAGTQRCGTGDLFASIIAADAVNGVDFAKSVKKASCFVKKCIQKSIEMNIPVTDGVAFEELLDSLK